MSFMLPLLYSLFLNAVANERTTNRVEVKSEGPVFNLHQALWVFDFAAAAYAEDPNPCLRQHNASLVYRITLPCDYIKDEV
ncbi:hypothetical protein Aduo_001085 [Ancylostoma duodenale]